MLPSVSRSCLVLLLALAVAACGSSGGKKGKEHYPVKPGTVHQQEDNYVAFVGKVVYVPQEGGFYGLQVGNTRFDPLRLPTEFEVDGKQVYVRAHVRDWVSGRNWGRMIHIVQIDPCCKPPPESQDEDD